MFGSIGVGELVILLIILLMVGMPIFLAAWLPSFKTQLHFSLTEEAAVEIKGLTAKFERSFIGLLLASIAVVVIRQQVTNSDQSFALLFLGLSIMVAFFGVSTFRLAPKVGRNRGACLAAAILSGLNPLAAIIFYVRMVRITRRFLQQLTQTTTAPTEPAV